MTTTTTPSKTACSALAASRARIASKADETRRQIERYLHDGIQQRRITLGLQLHAVREAVPPDRTITMRSPLGAGTSLHVELPLPVMRAYEELPH